MTFTTRPRALGTALFVLPLVLAACGGGSVDPQKATNDGYAALGSGDSGKAAELFTYSCSTATRAAMLAVGFFVAKGRGTGEKKETTIALTPATLHSSPPGHRELLASDWVVKWDRSRLKFPAEIPADEHPAFAERIRSHAQFRRG